MLPTKRKHEEVDGDQLGAPPSFAATLATAVANYRGREGHEIAKLKASIPGIMEDQWEEWKPKVLAWAAAGKDLCWFRIRFMCFTHYTPTLEDVKEGLPPDLWKMLEDGQLKITRATHNYPNQFHLDLNYSDLAEAKFREMEDTQAWPAETAETRESINKRQQEWHEEDRKREVRIVALQSKGWVQRFYENAKGIHYTTEDDKRETREWPDEVPKPSFDEVATAAEAVEVAAPEDAETEVVAVVTRAEATAAAAAVMATGSFTGPITSFSISIPDLMTTIKQFVPSEKHEQLDHMGQRFMRKELNLPQVRSL